MTVPTAGGPRRVLYRGPYNRPMPWVRPGRVMAATSWRLEPHSPVERNCWRSPPKAASHAHSALRMQGMAAIDVSPDGRRLLFTGRQSKGEIRTIRNLFASPASADRLFEVAVRAQWPAAFASACCSAGPRRAGGRPTRCPARARLVLAGARRQPANEGEDRVGPPVVQRPAALGDRKTLVRGMPRPRTRLHVDRHPARPRGWPVRVTRNVPTLVNRAWGVSFSGTDERPRSRHRCCSQS